MHEASHYITGDAHIATCMLCPHHCQIAPGKSGMCKVRRNTDGKLFTSAYNQITALAIDPIEKKPLYHFLPGRNILSIGTTGCNLRCTFCQNYAISQAGNGNEPRTITVKVNQIVGKALISPNNAGLAYTYNEPTIFIEFMIDCAREIHRAGLKNVVVSNGYIEATPLQELLPWADAFNIDLKAFNDNFYRKNTGGGIDPVLKTCKTIAGAGKHLEITFLTIPGLNDNEAEFVEMVKWIKNELGDEVPLHISRYFPAWKCALPPTPLSTLGNFAQSASLHLKYVYIGNAPGCGYESTYCPECRNLVVERNRYSTHIRGLNPDGHCANCGKSVHIQT